MTDHTSPHATSGFLVQLTGPLQAWGERSRFPHQRDTAAAPTRSALIGMLAAAHGRPRDASLDDLAPLHFTVRVDRRGTRLRDLHTVGGGFPRHLTVATAEDKHRSGETTTLLSHRYYLQDAAFTLAVTSEDTTLLHKSAEKLRRPRWAPYLGRRSCPPSGPLILTTVTATPVEHLLKLPLTRPAPGRNGPSQEATVPVEFASDLPLDGLSADGRSPADPILGEAQDEPLSFTPLDRRYRARPVHRITLRLPATQCAGYGTQYLTRLSSYLADHQLEVSSS